MALNVVISLEVVQEAAKERDIQRRPKYDVIGLWALPQSTD